VGTTKTVSGVGFSLSGTAAGNYSLVSGTLTTTASITAKSLTASITAANKTYDGTTSAIITGCTLTGLVGQEDVGCSATAGACAIGGADGDNYTLHEPARTMADITAKALTVSATGVNNVYDGTTIATVTLSDNRVSGDVFIDSYTSASFADKNVGTGKTV